MKTILTLLLAFTVSAGMAQSKIGNIGVPDSAFKAYLFDCYNRPDTVYEKSQSDGLVTHWNLDHTMGWSDSETSEQYQDRKERIRVYNANLKSLSIGQLEFSIPQRYLIPRKPSEIDFIKYLKLTSK